jgi:hypothetical protein
VKTNDETAAALARKDASRASERMMLASRPSNRWLEVDRYRMEASAPDAPKPMKEKRGRGRPPKKREEVAA